TVAFGLLCLIIDYIRLRIKSYKEFGPRNPSHQKKKKESDDTPQVFPRHSHQ
ncbi:MAG: hypothetical protein JST39_05725, partial [Bacteroidetes bacterium]|nr:hypothetical protein [Bacteroidota bacterium]